MAFGKKKRRRVKILLILICILILIGGLTVSGLIVFQTRIRLIKEGYDEELEALRTEAQNLKKTVWVSSVDLSAGVLIKKEQFISKEVSSSLDSNLFVTNEDFGKVLLIDLKANSPLLKTMVINEDIAQDLREEELNMLFIPSNLKKNQFIDARIAFSNGEDYIILSKIKIRDVDIESNTIWLWMNEAEILTLRSAIVDAYLHKGTKLYTVTYVAPSIQNEAIANYPINLDVLRVLKENPNILDEAMKALNNQVRIALDERLKKLKEEDVTSVDQGVKEEINNHDAAINNSSNEINILENNEDKSLEKTITDEGAEQDGFY